MTSLADFLRDRMEIDGFTNEDALASFLPLAREVCDAHAQGMVAPLDGIDELHVEGVRIWFEEAKRCEIRRADARLRRLEGARQRVVEVVLETRITTEVDEGSEQIVDLAIGDPEQPIIRPVYLPAYQCWEHQLDCHDPLTDIFSLGMLLASMVCGLDFFDPEQLGTFVESRKNLFSLASHLHPVIARVIVRMTELDRRQRAQELRSLVGTLENYRDQQADFAFELAQSLEFADRSKPDKQTVILTKLRERLFEVTRRNRLLHFRATMQSVNLTHASVPLSFDIEHIRPDQILVWNDRVQGEFTRRKPIALNKYLNFTEVLYLPSQLERIIAETRRDQAEYGFAQLRLVVCSLHWANLKENPIQQYDSPLVLLPVQLRKKKGIRDTFYLEAMATEAEINPVVRHLFEQLYAIRLPESIDLASTSLDALFETLSSHIHRSEMAVNLTKVDRPRIALIHETARRKLDQYRRRAKLRGRGVRQYLDLDYSYDPANYHPLGIKLFGAKVRPSATKLRDIVEENPRPRTFAAPPQDPSSVEKERQFYALQSGEAASPYEWTFNLCDVTLANFKYRRMSLVRDYETLLDEGLSNAAFDSVFSLTPRPVQKQMRQVGPLVDRFHVVPCDPTQARAIEEAKRGTSFIIQGPPGTGKSQTITNLIADYVARGKRVLFVCEKRAAIDVVYARLRQCGLADLCCLIHDSQTDKKEFVMDLKQTYENLLAQPNRQSSSEKRQDVVERFVGDLEPLQQFDDSMRVDRSELGISVRQLLDRCIELRECLPPLDVLKKEKLPSYAEWLDSKAAIARFEQSFGEIGDQRVLAKSPLRILAPRLADEQHPLDVILRAAREAKSLLEDADEILGPCGLPREQWQSFSRARQLAQHAWSLKPIADADQIQLFDGKSRTGKWLARQLKTLAKIDRAIEEARSLNEAWVDKLSPEETSIVLSQARQFELSVLSVFKLSWWRLRSMLNRCYDFKAHRLRPRWSQILQQLQDEQDSQRQRAKQLEKIGKYLLVDDDQAEEVVQAFIDVKAGLPAHPAWMVAAHDAIVESSNAIAMVAQIARAKPVLERAAECLSRIADDLEVWTIDELHPSLTSITDDIESVSDFLDCLRELRAIPQVVSGSLQSLPHTPREIEAAVADHALANMYRQDAALKRFNAQSHRRCAQQLEKRYDHWLTLNAQNLREDVSDSFLRNLSMSEQPVAKLTTQDEKEFKRRYHRGRRELEHEFGKQMRYKAIRDLVSDESGDVVGDLKPVWLMSPLSVSDTLPLSPDNFDVVIFDEASQITLEDAVPALYRAPQSIIVGDEMQLPPTDFFSAKRSAEEDEEEILIESDGELVQYDLDSGSLLSHAAKNLPATMLGWHYRSRSESLISFSNWAFYDGRLLTVPEESLASQSRKPVVVTTTRDAGNGAAAVLDRPVSFHRLPQGVYDKRRNRAEADYIAHVVRELLLHHYGPTLGVIAFSEAQQDEIEQALARLKEDDKPFRDVLEAELAREDNGQFVGLLVKNLENIQGDERDIVILSVCYGPPPTGNMRMNFGPINMSGGEKRLNVAFSRAKRHMAIVSSIDSTMITNDYNDGANCLKNYLRYAEAVSVGDMPTAVRIMCGLSRAATGQHDAAPPREVMAEKLAETLVAAGYHVNHAVGQSHFRCDLAVCKQGDSNYRLGILIDGQSYYGQSDLLERDMMRPRLLRAFGWRIAHVFAKDWLADPEAVMKRLVDDIEGIERITFD